MYIFDYMLVRALALVAVISLIPGGLYFATNQDFTKGYLIAVVSGLIGIFVSTILIVLTKYRPLKHWVKWHRVWHAKDKNGSPISDEIYALGPWYPEIIFGIFAGIVGAAIAATDPTIKQDWLGFGIISGLAGFLLASSAWFIMSALLRGDGMYIGATFGVFASLLLFPWNIWKIVIDREALVLDRAILTTVTLVVLVALAYSAIRWIRKGNKKHDLMKGEPRGLRTR